MNARNNEKILTAVRQHYSEAAKRKIGGDCCASGSTCCGSKPVVSAKSNAYEAFVYSQKQLSDVPEEALMGLGCGNPGAIAMINSGETVLDLGSGGGIDCFLASKQTGDSGQIIGVDMTPEMVSKARNNADKFGYENIEFRLGEIENLPVADEAADVIISNCVINLSPNKPRVCSEAFRVLKPGGRFAIADMIAVASLPEKIKKDLSLYASYIAGAVYIDDLKSILNEAGFCEINIRVNDDTRKLTNDCDKGTNLEEFVKSAMIEAVKPK